MENSKNDNIFKISQPMNFAVEKKESKLLNWEASMNFSDCPIVGLER